MSTPSIQSILTSLQADVTNLAAYVASLGGTSPAPVTTALSAVNAAMVTLQADASATPINQPSIQADVASVLRLLATLTAAIQAITPAI